ncbi:TonB family protein [Dysgonomonas sp. Marseille-P4361]|uniref:TonB family protein n=1 Tax=Dysgonomonas sp. Marseille-P4361 TaxID=2161820 RepID=UPI000D55A4FA|nr:TonB family protein [Dysgonomonas sp. Marseille-P4361]
MKYIVAFLFTLLLSINILCQNTDSLTIKPFYVLSGLGSDSTRIEEKLIDSLAMIQLVEEKNEPKIQMDEGLPVFTRTSMMPSFPGGEQKMNKFIRKHLKYPKKAKKAKIEGVVVVRVVVGKEGEIKKPIVKESVNPECDEEALRIIGLMPRWIPGNQGGFRVPIFYEIKVPFVLK